MLYEFIKYINPVWCFQLSPQKEIPYFLDYDAMPDVDKAEIVIDEGYSSWEISKADAAYQGFQKGFIVPEGRALNLHTKSTVVDKYRFIKKYYSQFWVYYIFILRIISLKNPVMEIRGFRRSFKTKRTGLFDKISGRTSLDDFHSELAEERPLVSIIIPTLNRYPYLENVMLDLENQSYTNFEVIVIDQSTPFDNSFYQKWKLNLVVKQQEEKALWLARNTGIKISKGRIICLTEDDVRLPGNWLENHLKCLDYYKADISSGVFFPASGQIPKSGSFFKYAEQFATGNACLYKDIFYRTGLFDRQFERMRGGDAEFGLRTYLKGMKSISNPVSFCEDVKAPVGGLRQIGNWDSFRPKKWLAPRPIPSALYLRRKYFGNKVAMYSLLISVPPSLLPYRFKKNKLIYLGGMIIMAIAAPVILYSVGRSWSLATGMLKEGAKIESLNVADKMNKISKELL